MRLPKRAGFILERFQRKSGCAHLLPGCAKDDLGRACIPPRSGRRWPSRFSRRLDRQRHTVENFFARIKRYRRIATRFEEFADYYLGFLLLTAVLDWLKLGG